MNRTQQNAAPLAGRGVVIGRFGEPLNHITNHPVMSTVSDFSARFNREPLNWYEVGVDDARRGIAADAGIRDHTRWLRGQNAPPNQMRAISAEYHRGHMAVSGEERAA